MKAIIYHADCPAIVKRYRLGIYEELIKGLKKNLNSFSIPLIHLTINGCKGLGDENIFFDGDVNEVNYNREKFFVEFLKEYAEETEIYFFTEPDSRINNMFPDLNGDASFTVLYGEQRITPQWRLAKKSALPIFEKAFSMYGENRRWWGGDTEIWGKMYQLLGKPNDDEIVYFEGLKIECRKYKLYNMTKSYYTQQFKSNKKNKLIDREGINESR